MPWWWWWWWWSSCCLGQAPLRASARSHVSGPWWWVPRPRCRPHRLRRVPGGGPSPTGGWVPLPVPQPSTPPPWRFGTGGPAGARWGRGPLLPVRPARPRRPGLRGRGGPRQQRLGGGGGTTRWGRGARGVCVREPSQQQLPRGRSQWARRGAARRPLRP